MLAALAALAVPAPAGAAAGACPVRAIASCFSVVVPLDRSGELAGAIRLRAARLRSRRATRPPIIGLTGGPGQAGVAFLETYDLILPTAGRDLVLFDQRGTGASGLLRCRTYEARLRFGSPAGVCARSLGARRSYYTSADSAEDLEALRVRLRAPRIVLYAVSYGTRVAVEYARRHPQRVERMVLDSPIGPGSPDALARETLGAVGRVVRAACRLGCGGAQAHPVADLARLAKRLRSAPIRRTARRAGRRVTIRIGADDLLGLLFTADLDAELMRAIPPAVRSALAGNHDRLVALKLAVTGDGSGGPISEFSPALFATTTCEESELAWDAGASPAQRRRQARRVVDASPASAFYPFDGTTALRAGLLPLCVDWPAPTRAVAPPPPLPTTVPTLVLSGELDLRTPLEEARELATALDGRLVVERGVGHQVLGNDPYGCAGRAVQAFLDRRTPATCRLGDARLSIGRAARRLPVASADGLR